jgi:energy-coupling factor transporter ATP-binding protein EcfA2
MTAIEVVDLTMAYGALRAVDSVNLEMAEGEFVGILGPNGGGKTTPLEMVEGLRRPDSGTATVLGLPFWPATPRSSRAAVGCGAWQLRRAGRCPVGRRCRLAGLLGFRDGRCATSSTNAATPAKIVEKVPGALVDNAILGLRLSVASA